MSDLEKMSKYISKSVNEVNGRTVRAGDKIQLTMNIYHAGEDTVHQTGDPEWEASSRATYDMEGKKKKLYIPRGTVIEAETNGPVEQVGWWTEDGDHVSAVAGLSSAINPKLGIKSGPVEWAE